MTIWFYKYGSIRFYIFSKLHESKKYLAWDCRGSNQLLQPFLHPKGLGLLHHTHETIWGSTILLAYDTCETENHTQNLNMIQGQGTTIKIYLHFFFIHLCFHVFLPFFREHQLNKSIFQVAFFVLITPWSWSVHILEFRASNGDKYAHVVLRDILYKVYQKKCPDLGFFMDVSHWSFRLHANFNHGYLSWHFFADWCLGNKVTFFNLFCVQIISTFPCYPC